LVGRSLFEDRKRRNFEESILLKRHALDQGGREGSSSNRGREEEERETEGIKASNPQEINQSSEKNEKCLFLRKRDEMMLIFLGVA
jgi:hypothetical protein